MKKQYSIPALAIILIIAVGVYYIYQRPFNPPKQNPSPHYFVTIHGSYDPNIQPFVKSKRHFAFWAEYSAYNPECKYYAHNAHGYIHMTPEKIVMYRIDPDKTGQFNIRIPLDKYSPGKCNWKITGIYSKFYSVYPITQKDYYVSNNFYIFGKGDSSEYDMPTAPIANKAVIFYSQEEGESFGTLEGSIDSEKVKDVPRNKSYDFSLNFITNRQ